MLVKHYKNLDLIQKTSHGFPPINADLVFEIIRVNSR